MQSRPSTSRIRKLVRKTAAIAHGLIALSLIAAVTYAVSTPKPAAVALPSSHLTGYSLDQYKPGETYGGTSPIDTCLGCDFWGKQSLGTSSPPQTDPDEMVNPATGDLAENYTLFSDADPGGGFKR